MNKIAVLTFIIKDRVNVEEVQNSWLHCIMEQLLKVINVHYLFVHTKYSSPLSFSVISSLRWFNLIHYVRCSSSHIMLERSFFKCFIHLSLFYIIILHYYFTLFYTAVSAIQCYAPFSFSSHTYFPSLNIF